MPNVIDNDEEQSSEWIALYGRITAELERFGKEDAFGNADYWLLDDNYGTFAQHLLYINNLHLLTTPIVQRLRQVLSEFARWEIVVAIDVPGTGDAWPRMGLIIRQHEIIDGLQRDFFPPEYRSLAFEGSRLGTERD